MSANVALLKTILTRERCTVVTASNGQQALAMVDSAESVILSLALVIEARDAYTDGHCQRLAGYATALGAALNLNEDQQAALYRGGYLHDVGKIGIPDSVPSKPAD